MVLRDAAANELWLSGVAAGHNGESARMAMQILVEAGFPPEQALAVFVETSVELQRTPASNEPSSAVAPIEHLDLAHSASQSHDHAVQGLER